MCGIVGFLGKKDDYHLLEKMNHTQTHRGPDSKGHFHCKKNNFFIGMARLSIVDIIGGKQPMFSSDNRYSMVYNGEIFNAPELRETLIKKGYKFKTSNSDTEVVLALFESYGIKMLKYLNGMFSFVIYDRKIDKIFCARDQFGIKPFHYANNGNRFSFASEIKSLVDLPWISKDLDFQSISDYFSFQFIPSPRTIYTDIKKLEPGHYLTFDIKNKKLNIDCYWKPSFGTRSDIVGVNELTNIVYEELNNAVKRWTMSDVPIAMSLSGGIDSSIITSILANISSEKIHTYTLGFEEELDIDEIKFASKLSSRYGTSHNEVIINEKDLLGNIDPMINYLDEPYSGGLPSWFIYKEISKGFKVAMSGTGADELFGNYNKSIYLSSFSKKIRGLLKYIKNKGSIKDLISYHPSSTYQPMIFTDNFKKKNLFNNNVTDNVIDSSISNLHKNWNFDLNSQDAFSEIDLKYQLPEEFLFMSDRFSMAHSIELRVPFLDKNFVETMYGIPSNKRIRLDNNKFILKKAFKNYIPEEILNGPKKGFVLPIDKWLRREFQNSAKLYSSKSVLKKQNIFNEDLYKNFVKPYMDGKNNDCEKVWSWLMFQKWYDINVVNLS